MLLLLIACNSPEPVVAVRLVAADDETCGVGESMLDHVVAYFDEYDVPFEPRGCTLDDVPSTARFYMDEDVSYSLNIPYAEDGSATIFLVDSLSVFGGGSLGGAFSRVWICGATIALSQREPQLMAHELGHFLNLGHDDREGNLMQPEVTQWPDAWLDDDQVAHTFETVDKLQWCHDL